MYYIYYIYLCFTCCWSIWSDVHKMALMIIRWDHTSYHHSTFVIAMWLLCCVASTMLISPIIYIGCCSGVEDWEHLWATPTLLCCFIKIDDELAWLITKKERGVRHIFLLCVILMTSSLLLSCLPVSLLTATTTIYDGYYLGILSQW
jgi:hypothetical protein